MGGAGAAAAANAPDGAEGGGGAAHDSLRLFQHLLTERGAVRQLLGDDGNVAAPGTPLARFVPDVSGVVLPPPLPEQPSAWVCRRRVDSPESPRALAAT